MNEVKLIKPCPFCGSKQIGVMARNDHPNLPLMYGVTCYDCQAGSCQFFRTKEEAIEAWNTRHEPPTPGGAIVPVGNERLRG